MLFVSTVSQKTYTKVINNFGNIQPLRKAQFDIF